MKRKSLIALLLTIVMSLSVFATSCSKPKTIEEYVAKDKEASEQVQKAADTAGLTVSFEENDVVYTYDLASIENVNEEVIKSDMMKEQLASALDSTTDTFVGLCKQLEEESKIEGVQIVVNYTYGDEIIITKTFNSSGAVE
jgi:predicted RND superfamily exporter protein